MTIFIQWSRQCLVVEPPPPQKDSIWTVSWRLKGQFITSIQLKSNLCLKLCCFQADRHLCSRSLPIYILLCFDFVFSSQWIVISVDLWPSLGWQVDQFLIQWTNEAISGVERNAIAIIRIATRWKSPCLQNFMGKFQISFWVCFFHHLLSSRFRFSF